MENAILYILVGIPGSGKSTWAKTHFPSCYYISRDECRMSLITDDDEYFSKEADTFNMFANKIASSLIVNHRAVADATHLNDKSRKKLISAVTKLCNNFISFNIIFIYFNTDFDTCIARNEIRKGRARVPADIISQMYDALTEPSKKEDPRVAEIWTIT